MSMTTAKGINSGWYKIYFKDGGKYQFTWPDVKLISLLSKEPSYIFQGPFVVTDLNNKLESITEFVHTK